MKIVILHTRLSGYLAACLRELKQREEAELMIFAYPGDRDAPFDRAGFEDLGVIHNRREFQEKEIFSTVRDFGPDAVLVSGWGDKGYFSVCKQLKALGVPVIAGCDTQWKGSFRQHLASWVAPWHVRKAIDVLWVTGERQATLARVLGYQGDRLWDGYYACDWGRFGGWWMADGEGRMADGEGWMEDGESVSHRHRRSQSGVPDYSPFTIHHSTFRSESKPHFLFVGRYVDVKGLDTLVAAYRVYRDTVDEPWGLVCAGAGPLRQVLLDAGAEDRGFVQPDDLPQLMAEASAFVLPSRFEPWGVVVQEAAASGLPLICSDACGAGVHLLRDLWNGRVFPAGNVVRLAECMIWLHHQDEERTRSMGEKSHELSRQYTPQRWAETLLSGIEKLKD